MTSLDIWFSLYSMDSPSTTLSINKIISIFPPIPKYFSDPKVLSHPPSIPPSGTKIMVFGQELSIAPNDSKEGFDLSGLSYFKQDQHIDNAIKNFNSIAEVINYLKLSKEELRLAIDKLLEYLSDARIKKVMIETDLKEDKLVEKVQQALSMSMGCLNRLQEHHAIEEFLGDRK